MRRFDARIYPPRVERRVASPTTDVLHGIFAIRTSRPLVVPPVEIRTFFGLPAHPLLVHLPVVFIPLAFLGTVAIAVRRRWRERFVWLTVAAAAIATVGTFLAYYSGVGLKKAIDPTPTLQEHIKLADSMRWYALLALVLLAAYVWVARVVDGQEGHEEPGAMAGRDLSAAGLTTVHPPAAATNLRKAMVVLAIAAVVSSGVSAAWTYRTGHEGAKATWSGIGQVK